MSIFRRRLMMVQEKASPYDDFGYIKAGKVFHLDAFERGTTVNNEWVDLIGGQVFVPSDQSTDAVWSGGKLITPYEMICADYALDVTLDNMTLEAVFELTSDGNGVIFKAKRTSTTERSANSAGLYIYNKNILLSNRRNYKPTVRTLSLDWRALSATALTASNGRVIINGSARTVSSYDFIYPNDDHAQIGTKTGSISSIRIYNRVLTAEEQLYNQRIDNERFNLGLEL